MSALDLLGRPLGSLRVSVTDRCNLRCQYCMPEKDYVWLPRNDILTFEETSFLVDVFAGVGVDRVRITGGEPLLRTDLPDLVRLLAAKSSIQDLALTTNGVLLADQAAALRAAGLHRLTVSLDTLRPDRFRVLTRFDSLGAVHAGLVEAAARFDRVKIDTVVIRGVNDDELVDILEYGKQLHAEVRFIEYMDVGGATRWSLEDVVPRSAMLQTLEAHYGRVAAIDEVTSAPADRFHLDDGTTFGIISSTTAPFCRSCDRSRLTADGLLVPLPLCLVRYRPETTAARRSVGRRVTSLGRAGLACAQRPRCGAETRNRESPTPHSGRNAPKTTPPRNAHARGVVTGAIRTREGPHSQTNARPFGSQTGPETGGRSAFPVS